MKLSEPEHAVFVQIPFQCRAPCEESAGRVDRHMSISSCAAANKASHFPSKKCLQAGNRANHSHAWIKASIAISPPLSRTCVRHARPRLSAFQNNLHITLALQTRNIDERAPFECLHLCTRPFRSGCHTGQGHLVRHRTVHDNIASNQNLHI